MQGTKKVFELAITIQHEIDCIVSSNSSMAMIGMIFDSLSYPEKKETTTLLHECSRSFLSVSRDAFIMRVLTGGDHSEL